MNLLKFFLLTLVFCLPCIAPAPAQANAIYEPTAHVSFVQVDPGILAVSPAVEPSASATVLSSSSFRLDYSGFSGSGAYTVAWWPHDAPDSKTYAYPTAQTYTITGLTSGLWDSSVQRGSDYIIVDTLQI